MHCTGRLALFTILLLGCIGPVFAFAETPPAEVETFLQVLDHEEFIRLTPANRAAYIGAIRETLVELAESERDPEFEFFNGTDKRYGATAAGWRAGYFVLLEAFAPLAQAASEDAPKVFMSDAEYRRRLEVIEQRMNIGYRGAPVDPRLVEQMKGEKAKLQREYVMQLTERRKLREVKLIDLDLQREEELRKISARASPILARDRFYEDKHAEAEAVNRKYEALKEKVAASVPDDPEGLTGAQPAAAAVAGQNPETTQSGWRSPPSRTPKLECFSSIPKCIDRKTKAGRAAINKVAVTLRERGSSCIYGGLKSNRKQKTANPKTNMRAGNCEPRTSLKIDGFGTVGCVQKGEVLCNPMLFGVLDSVKEVRNSPNQVFRGLCVSRTSTVTGDCAVKFAKVEKEKKQKGLSDEPQFWDLDFPGVNEIFNSTSGDLNTTCSDKDIRTVQCNECTIIQRRLRKTRGIASCKTTATGSRAAGAAPAGEVVRGAQGVR